MVVSMFFIVLDYLNMSDRKGPLRQCDSFLDFQPLFLWVIASHNQLASFLLTLLLLCSHPPSLIPLLHIINAKKLKVKCFLLNLLELYFKNHSLKLCTINKSPKKCNECGLTSSLIPCYPTKLFNSGNLNHSQLGKLGEDPNKSGWSQVLIELPPVKTFRKGRGPW